MDMDEVQTQACRKIPRSGSGISGHQTEELNGTGTVSGNAEGGDSGINRLREWNPSSRIIRVSRASGGKDRHSKVWTSKGLRDRRVRLSVSTAIQFYDLQDRLGYDQPSKAVEWLIKSAADSIAELPSINTSFPDTPNYHHQLSDEKIGSNGGNHQNQAFSLSKSTCSSTSDTSKNSSGLSLSRSEIHGKNRVKARERARERATKEKERDNNNNNIRNVEPQNSSSFTQLLTGSFGGGDNSPAGCYSHQGYNGQFQLGTSFPHHQRMSIVPPFSISGDLNHHHQEPRHKFSFVPESLYQMAGSAGVDFGTLNFSISSSSSSGGGLSGYNRGTLQSNLPSLFTTNVQRFSSSSAHVDGADLPFFIGSTASPFENHHNNNHNNHPQHHEFMAGSDGSLQLYHNDGNRCSSDHKDRGKSGSFD